jgi:broad specificity phosphatase PhoE
VTWLILIRHGETDWNVEGRYQGQADPPLNERGLEQAVALAQALRDVGLDILYSSPLRRARDTAEVVANRLAIPLRIEPRLMEINQGEWEGQRRDRIEQLCPELLRRWDEDPWAVSPPGGESLVQVQQRVYAALDDVLAANEGRRVGLITHRLPIALIKLKYQGLPPDAVCSLDLPNTFWEEIDIAARAGPEDVSLPRRRNRPAVF